MRRLGPTPWYYSGVGLRWGERRSSVARELVGIVGVLLSHIPREMLTTEMLGLAQSAATAHRGILLSAARLAHRVGLPHVDVKSSEFEDLPFEIKGLESGVTYG
jgi:hypothetical protein